MSLFRPAGVITITTDLGHKGPFVGVMKGVIATRYPGATVIDVTHDIPAHWPPEAGFWISRAYPYFPGGSVHLGIVDPGVGTERDILVAEVGGHLFIAPDNGLLATLLPRATSIRKLDLERLAGFNLPVPSSTFHGRDIIAPVAAELAAGKLRVEDTGSKTSDWTPGWLDEPEVSHNRVSGVIVTIDAFGNLISNIDATLIDGFRSPEVKLSGRRFPMQATYGRAEPGSYLALINSFGVLEIARVEGNAAEHLGSDRGAPVVVTDLGAG